MLTVLCIIVVVRLTKKEPSAQELRAVEVMQEIPAPPEAAEETDTVEEPVIEPVIELSTEEADPVEDTEDRPTMLDEGTLDSYIGSIDYTNERFTVPGGEQFVRTYAYSTGEVFRCGRLTAGDNQPETLVLDEFIMPGETGTARYYNGRQWKEIPIIEGSYGYGTLFLSTGEASVIVCPPAAYRDMDGVISYIKETEGRLLIEKKYDGWHFTFVSAPAEPGDNIEYMFLSSPKPLIDWSLEGAEKDWAGYIFSRASRWTYDGYYYTTPDNYIPKVENSFYRLPAAHITGKFVVNSDKYRAARYFALPMLHVMRELQNDMGFFPTEPGCQWLMDDYGVGPGFFDTRFNADLVLAMMRAIKRLGADFLTDTVRRYGEYFLGYAANQGIADGEGILLPDYWNPAGCGISHTSLNHQCAQALMCFELSSVLEDSRFYDLAIKLVEGVTDKTDFWMARSDKNLNYAWLDGEVVGIDYPYLTYDDIVKLQNAFVYYTGRRSEQLDALAQYKLTWMKKHHVTGYIEE